MRVDKGGEYLGGTVGVRNSGDKEGSCCVLCVVWFFLLLFCLFLARFRRRTR
jgi:hypothetical protein